MKKIIWNKKEYKILDKNKNELNRFLNDITYYLIFRRDELCRKFNIQSEYHDDILQLFLIKTVELIPKYNDKRGATFKTLLHKSLNNFLLDIMKSKKQRSQFGFDDLKEYIDNMKNMKNV